MVYVLAFILCGLLATLALIKPSSDRLFGLITAMFLILFTGLRENSVDYEQYEIIFNIMRNSSLEYPERLFLGKDVLFGVLIAGLIEAGGGAQTLFITSAIISIGLKYFVFQKTFNNATAALFTCLCVNFFLHDFTQIRVAISIGFCFVALICLCNRSVGYWFGLCIVAAGFHASASMFLLLCLSFFLPEKYRVLGLILTTIFVARAIATIFGGESDIETRSVDFGDQRGASSLGVFVILLKLAILSTIYFRVRRFLQAEKKLLVQTAFLLSWSGLILFLVLRNNSTVLAFRLYEFLEAFSVIVVIAAIQRRNGPTGVFIFSYCILALVSQIAAGLILPYSFGTF